MAILKVVKKFIPVEAVQWTGENRNEVIAFGEGRAFVEMKELYVDTLEGRMTSKVGDYLMKGIRGEFYICEKSIFEESYMDASPKTKTINPNDHLEAYLMQSALATLGYQYVEGAGYDQISMLDLGPTTYLLIANRGFVWNHRDQNFNFGVGVCTIKKDFHTTRLTGEKYYRARDENGKPILYGLLDDGSQFFIIDLVKL